MPPVDYTSEGLLDNLPLTDDQKSVHGLTHVPSTHVLGGIIAHGGIKHESILNLAAIRTLGITKNGAVVAESTTTLRRYILGLALVALSKPTTYNLRQGCLLVRDISKPLTSTVVWSAKEPDPFVADHGKALSYAKEAAKRFGVGKDRSAKFDPKKLQQTADDKTKKKDDKKSKKATDKG